MKIHTETAETDRNVSRGCYFKDTEIWKEASKEEQGWLAMPDPVERQLLDWQKRYSSAIRLKSVVGYTGMKTYVAILTDSTIADEDKVEVLAIQPHGHEPAQTAGAMDFISQLLTGKTLLGKPSRLENRKEILQRFYIMINTLGNPDGRLRGGIQCFDEKFITTLGNPDSPLNNLRDDIQCFEEKFSELQAQYYFNGKLADSVLEGRIRKDGYSSTPYGYVCPPQVELDPNHPIGMRYEMVEEDYYVDPWNIRLPIDKSPNSLSRLVSPYLKTHPFRLVLDLHQYPQIDGVEVWCPKFALDIPDAYPEELANSVATRIEKDWRTEGFPVRKRFYYDACPFISSIHLICPGRPAILTVEVGGGCGFKSAFMSKWRQGQACANAIISAISSLLLASPTARA